MAKTDELLRLVREIADPSEAILREAAQIAADPNTAPEIAEACRVLQASLRDVFGVAGYIMKRPADD